jgi:hypothetical protein
MATNATVTKEPQLVVERRGGGALSSLRYSGFDQRDNTRHYVFQYCVPGEKARSIVVSAEIPLLVQHHVRIQDGPALCLHALTLAVQGFDPSQIGLPPRVLTAKDLVAYLASLPVPAIKGKRAKEAEAEADGPSQ